jgi:uncharacterized CHY-type Zn-finger protein
LYLTKKDILLKQKKMYCCNKHDMCFKRKEDLDWHKMESHGKIKKSKKKSVKPRKNSKKTKKSIKPRKNSKKTKKSIKPRKNSKKTKKSIKPRKNSTKSMSSKNSKNSECKESLQKKYQTRPSPPYPAQACKNSIILGNDEEYYKSLPDKNGIYKWKRI